MGGFAQEDDKSYFYDGAGYAMRWGPKVKKQRPIKTYTHEQQVKRAERRVKRRLANERRAAEKAARLASGGSAIIVADPNHPPIGDCHD